MAGDMNALDTIAPTLLRNYKQIIGDNSIGSYSHTHDGTIYYEDLNTGQITGVNVDQFVGQSGIAPEEIFGENAGEIRAGLSSGAKEKYKNTREATQLALEKEKAGIEQTKAHTGLYNAQSGKTVQEMEAPKPKYSDKIVDNFTKQNSEWINKNREEHRKLNSVATAYDKIASIIEEESNDPGIIGGRSGSGTIATLQRFLNKSNTKSEQNQASLDMLQLPLMEDLKRIYGAQVSDIDLKSFLSTLPSLDKNPESSISEARNRANEIKQRLREDQVTQEVLEDEFGYSEPYHSLAVQRRVNEKLQAETSKLEQSNISKPTKTFNFKPDK